MAPILFAASCLLLAGRFSDALQAQAAPPQAGPATQTLVDRPESKHGVPDPSADGRWAFWARMRHDSTLGGRGPQQLDLNTHPSGDNPKPEAVRRIRACNWPFVGMAPEPPTAVVLAPQSPIASVEWRRRGSRLGVTFACGQEPLQCECHRAMQALQSTIHDSDVPPDWARDEEIPTTCPDSEGFLDQSSEQFHDAGIERKSWASTWADCYTLGASGMHMVVATDTQRNISRVTVTGLGAGGRDRIASDELTAIFGDEGTQGIAFLIHADFDANGTPDYFLGMVSSGNGLARTSYDGAFVLADSARRMARITRFEEYDIELIDHDGNGRAEILVRSLGGEPKCIDGRCHNFWIWDLLGFQDLQIVDLRSVDTIRSGNFVGRFPHIEWLSHDPRDRFRRLLSDEQRERLTKPRFPLYRPNPKKPAQARR